MIFLIEFDRKHAQLVSLKTFDDTDRLAAQNASAELEFSAGNEGRSSEIVLLEGHSHEAVQKTHRRYFEKILNPAVLGRMLDNAVDVHAQIA